MKGANLQAADLSGANLEGANLISARFWRADVTTDLGLSDLTWADFARPLSDDEIKDLRTVLDTIPDHHRRPAIKRLLGGSPGADQPVYRLSASSEQPVLVSDINNPIFKTEKESSGENIPKEWLITNPTPSYTSALMDLLVDRLASRDPATAAGIAHRAVMQLVSIAPEHRVLYATLGCRLMAKASALKLTQGAVFSLSVELKSGEIGC